MVFSSNELDLIILQNGKNGISADSKYIWVKYSQNADGSDLTDDPTNAVYIGIAYNKESIHESNNPADYSWSRIQGDKGTDGYTVVLSNENVSFSVDYETNTAISKQTYSSTVLVMQGVEERTDFVIGEIESNYGITIIKNRNTITLSVESGTYINAENGSFRIPISIDGLVFFKDITWNLAKQGKNGESAINIILGNEAQNIPCTEEGIVSDGFLINIPFNGFIGTEKVGATATVGLLPNGVTLGSNTPATGIEDGLIVLNVAAGADFGGVDVLTGDIAITFTLSSNSQSWILTDEADNILTNEKNEILIISAPGIESEHSVVKYFTWSKTKDGSSGSMTIYELEASSLIINKNIDDTLTPGSIEFYAYSRESNSVERVDYNGMFIIEESSNGTAYETKYVSAKNENTVTYTPSSSEIHSIRCTLCQADKITITLDRQTIPILNDSDNLKPIIDEITTTMSGLENKIDAVNNSITNKIWKTDITTAINQYDNSTIETLRDRISEQQITVDGITSTVKDVQTEVEKKADGSTVITLEERVSKSEQNINGFKQTVESTYATKDELEDALINVKSLVLILSDEIKTIPTDSQGNNGNYNGCKTTASMMLGNQNITGAATFSALASEGVTGLWDEESYTYTVTNMTTDSGYVDITGTYNEQRVTKRFSIVKIKSIEGQVYSIQSSTLILEKTSENRFDPRTVTFTSHVSNISGNLSSFDGYFKIYEKPISGDYTVKYSSTSPESSKEYVPSSLMIQSIKCELYISSDFQNLVDSQTVAIISNDDINIGVRNYIRNSKTMIFGDYGLV